MSRCFPFPPPGYEKKARIGIEDTDLLTKEKKKEKKHKKDKKDKEKKESKEKKEKDRSTNKDKEKKDRKERHRKGRDRDKEENWISDEKRVEGRPGFDNGDKFGSKNLQNNENKDYKYVQELARRIKDEDGASGSQLVQKIAATGERAKVLGVAVGSSIGNQSERKEKLDNKNEDQRKVNGQRNHIDPRGLGKAFGHNLSSMGQESSEGIARLVEKKDAKKQMEGKEKSKHKEIDGNDDKHKSRDREKNRKSKHKDQDKEKKKEEKEKEITEPHKEQPNITIFRESGPKLKDSSKDLDFQNIKSSDPLKLNSMNSTNEGNPGKRKQLEINGFLLDNGKRPNKFPRPLSSPLPVVENEKKLEPCQTAIQFSSEKQGPANNHRVDIKDRKINGLIATQLSIVGSMKPFFANATTNENGGTSSKPPHPDTKYLSKMLSVPKMEEWSDVDDQEWLFSSNHMQSKKSDGFSPGIDCTQQVWADAVRIDTADISALPYVIPF